MTQSISVTATDELLHAADVEELERRVMELALDRTHSRDGAIFLWDADAGGLAVHFHMVDGVVIKLPGVVLRRRDSRPNGIALHVHDRNEPYRCADTRADPHYAPYFQDVRSVAAVPIPYQRRSIGVISVSSREPAVFTDAHIAKLQALAASSAKFLRRAQLFWARGQGRRRPFLIKGLSAAWLEVERQLEQVAPTDAPVLVCGESGTGKELVANALHFNSERAAAPFVVVNCAAIPETLLESALFGHTKGAFTGAAYERQGEFRRAHGGTLFLDEIGDLSLALQAKLLRAAEDGEVQPLGSDRPPRVVDVRLICATHRSLPQMVREGRFRQDLYHRLSVVTLELPPLRTYRNNLDAMARVFLLQAARRTGKPVERLSATALGLLRAHDFPGNVRELKNAVEHAVIMAGGEEVLPEHLPSAIRTAHVDPSTSTQQPTSQPAGTLAQMRERWLAPLERQYLLDLLRQCHGDVNKVAEHADVNRVTVYRLLKRRGIALRRTFDDG